MPCQVSGQSVWMNSSKLVQGAGGVAGAGTGAGTFWARAASVATKIEASAARACHQTDRICTLPYEKPPNSEKFRTQLMIEKVGDRKPVFQENVAPLGPAQVSHEGCRLAFSGCRQR